MTRRRRRWLRPATPFMVLVAAWTFTVVAHSLEQPNLRDPGTLAPTGTGPDGSSRLAARLTADGVTIQRVDSSRAAVAAAGAIDATIFVPAPNFLAPAFVHRLESVPGEHRVVVVKPSYAASFELPLPVHPGSERWATGVAPPGCSASVATSAGAAEVRRTAYSLDSGTLTQTIDCYGSAVIGARTEHLEIIVVGATEPFRNSRIGEAGNEALAAGLLGAHSRLIWLDVHADEPVVVSDTTPVVTLPQYRRDQQNRTNTGFPTIDAFPSGLWAAFVLAALGAVLIGLVRGRRLGGLVAEPLPVLVPAAEAVTGRGRLYRRIEARESALEALRASALRRLSRVLNPFGPPPSPDLLVAQLAQRTGRSEVEVRQILAGPPPSDDEGFVADVARLDGLVAGALTDINRPLSTPAADAAADAQRPNPQGGPA